jgi:hypothetical protein
LFYFFWCSEDNLDVDLDALVAPQNISALTTVTQDNTGKVTFTSGEGVTQYEILLEMDYQAYVGLGGTVEHTYKEGVYNAKIIGTTLNGKEQK